MVQVESFVLWNRQLLIAKLLKTHLKYMKIFFCILLLLLLAFTSEINSRVLKRSLRMYTNFSDIPMTNEDRVLILMGPTHSAYFDVFIENSPKYKLENAVEYTNYIEIY